MPAFGDGNDAEGLRAHEGRRKTRARQPLAEQPCAPLPPRSDGALLSAAAGRARRARDSPRLTRERTTRANLSSTTTATVVSVATAACPPRVRAVGRAAAAPRSGGVILVCLAAAAAPGKTSRSPPPSACRVRSCARSWSRGVPWWPPRRRRPRRRLPRQHRQLPDAAQQHARLRGRPAGVLLRRPGSTDDRRLRGRLRRPLRNRPEAPPLDNSPFRPPPLPSASSPRTSDGCARSLPAARRALGPRRPRSWAYEPGAPRQHEERPPEHCDRRRRRPSSRFVSLLTTRVGTHGTPPPSLAEDRLTGISVVPL